MLSFESPSLMRGPADYVDAADAGTHRVAHDAKGVADRGGEMAHRDHRSQAHQGRKQAVLNQILAGLFGDELLDQMFHHLANCRSWHLSVTRAAGYFAVSPE